jgi:hypothetical protein
MAFLDNSGDIILDAVLTDTGRMRLAKGDGSFKIVKFALGDDEINYWSYENINYVGGRNTSGSAFYDLSILQTPVLEAFTNNTSLLKHRLVSYTRNDLLYLPIIKQNITDTGYGLYTDADNGNTYVVAVDLATETTLGINSQGVLNGSKGAGTNKVRVDFGLDSPKVAKETTLDADLMESQLIIELDNRLGKLVNVKTGETLDFDFLDDDQVATYIVTNAIDTQYQFTDDSTNNIAGPFQGMAEFKFKASISLQTSNALYNQFGTTGVEFSEVDSATFNFIDTLVRITGGTTGFSVDIPLRFAKKITG